MPGCDHDVLTGKVTLPLIHSLRQVGPESRREIIGKINDNGGRESFETVFDFVRENGGIEYAYRRADELSQQGLEEIGHMPPSVYLDSLTRMVQFTTARTS